MDWGVLHLIAASIGILLLGILSYNDLQKRRVNEAILYGFIGLSFILATLFTFLSPVSFVYVVSIVISLTFGSLLAILAERLSLIKKGDREAIILLSLLSPFFSTPLFFKQSLLFYPLPLYIFDLMLNFIFLLVLVPLGIFLYNCFRFLTNDALYKQFSGYRGYPFLLFLGVPYPIAKVKSKDPEKYLLLEDKFLDGWHFNFQIHLSEDIRTKNESIIETAEREEKTALLIQPTLPILLFLFISVFLFLSFGDLPFFFFSLITSIV